MLTLGLETSCGSGSVALFREDHCLGERELSQAGRRHARALLPEIGELFAEAGCRPKECDLVAVSVGPGSFTGLRVGIVCAKTWAYATRCAVTGIDSLLAVAADTPPGIDRVIVVSDAQRGELFRGEYARDQSGWTLCEPIRIEDREALLESLLPEDCVSGPALETLAECLASRCRVLARSHWYPQARNVAGLGCRAFNSGNSDDSWALKPYYLRRSAAEEKLDRLG